jgi:hypothetical protein
VGSRSGGTRPTARRFYGRTAIVLLGAATGLCLIAVPSGFGDTSSSLAVAPTASLPDSTFSTAPVLATGSVAGATSGWAIALAWPNQATITADTDAGVGIPLTPVAQASIGASGSYTLRVPSLSSLGVNGSSDGFVNFSVWVSAPGHAEQSYGMTHDVSPTDALTGDTPVVNQAVAAPIDDESATFPASPDDPSFTGLDTTANDPSVASGEAETSSPDLLIQPAGGGGCFEYPKKELPWRWARIGETFNGTGTAHFGYTVGATSSFGVGFSASGQYGSWSAQGTSNHSSTVKFAFNNYGAGSRIAYYKQVRYEQYEEYSGCATGFPVVTGYDARAYKDTGGFMTVSGVGAPSANYCVPEAKGTWTRTTSHLNTFATGVGIADILGINLSARTGASSTASLSYTFTSTGHQMCGNNTTPATAARVQSK